MNKQLLSEGTLVILKEKQAHHTNTHHGIVLSDGEGATDIMVTSSIGNSKEGQVLTHWWGSQWTKLEVVK